MKVNIKTIKTIASALTGLGVGKTVDILLKENLPVNMDWKARVATFIGSAALSGLISAKCSDYVEEQIDECNEMIQKIKDGVKVNKSDDEIKVEANIEMTD